MMGVVDRAALIAKPVIKSVMQSLISDNDNRRLSRHLCCHIANVQTCMVELCAAVINSCHMIPYCAPFDQAIILK